MSIRAASAALMAVRNAVQRCVADIGPSEVVVVACSGGPDSVALAGATAWVARRRGIEAHAVVVDHQLQTGSADIAAAAAQVCRDLSLHTAQVVTVCVGRNGGPEAAAREARYTALADAATALGARCVLLGHTRDDQAETVLLGLVRGSGARSLSGMSRSAGMWRRPLLDLPRNDVHAAAAELLAPFDARPWSDPHNVDSRFARVRARRALAELERSMGRGVVLGLARSADLLRDDADALDAIASAEYQRLVSTGEGNEPGLSADCAELLQLERAVRTRVIRAMALNVGSSADELSAAHINAVDSLVVDWHGQGEVRLPGAVAARRLYGRLCLLQDLNVKHPGGEC